MASMREIKRRKTSIQSTAQITKAMKLVSTVKFQKAKVKAETTRPYFDKMYETVSSILSRSGNIHHRYLMQGESQKKAVIVITSNRGLAGGYNSNVEKAVTSVGFNPADVYRAAMDIGRDVLNAFSSGEVGEIWMAYTVFKNTITHIPKMIRLLPVAVPEEETAEEKKDGPLLLMNFEPEPEEVLDAVIPKYINSVIYGGMMDAVASENGARMTAMDNATSNAEDMIENLTLSYNRARQGAITQEITEIVSGAEALK